MKIIKFIAEDVKGIKAVEITPDGSLVEIAGENGAGKSSVLDAIWLVLGGGVASKGTETPLREGAKSGFATLVLSDMVATRKWTPTTTTIKVTSLDGKQVFSSPQAVLDALRAKFLDPGHFIEKSPKEQRQAILDLADIGAELDAIAAERKRLYDARTIVGQRGKAIGEVPAPDAGVPDAEVSATDLIAKIREGESENYQISTAENRAAELHEQIAAWKEQIEVAQNAFKSAKARARGTLVDIDALNTELANLEDTNRAVRANADRKARAAEQANFRAKYEGLTSDIAALDTRQSGAIAKADLPLPGLGFSDDGITLDGRPFSDSNDGEKMIAALEIAAAFSPELRVIQMRKASLLDRKNFQVAADWAEKNDYQIWMETVGEGHGSAIVIEDGRTA